MSSFSPGTSNNLATATPKEQSKISSYGHQHPANVQALTLFKSILQSCYGPSGHLKMLQNNCGGHVTMTSSSRRLLKSLTLSKPILRLITAAVEGHLRVYSDGGLYTALLACTLIEGCWESGLHPMLCVTVNELMQDICLRTMDSPEICRVPVDVASIDAMLSLVMSVLSPKRGCGMAEHEIRFIASLVLQSFVSSVPSADHQQLTTVPRIQIIGVESRAVSESHIVQGILVEAPDLLAAFTQDVLAPRLPSGPHTGGVRVALYNISLAGDSEEFIEARYELSPGLNTGAATLASMRTLVDRLVEMRVGLVACQKVIHPSVKRYLREKGLLALDRLSLLYIGAVQQITGAEVLSTLDSTIPSSSLGQLTDIRHHVMFGKSYLHLTNKSSSMCTLVLCNLTEQALEELKHVCQVAHHTLALTLKDPTALPGAGCLEVILAHHIRMQVSTLDEGTWRDVGCTKTQFLQLAENFSSCLEAASEAIDPQDNSNQVTDSASHHRWHLPPGAMADPDWLHGLRGCGCGMRAASEHADGSAEWSVVGRLKCGVHRMKSSEGDGVVGPVGTVGPVQSHVEGCAQGVRRETRGDQDRTHSPTASRTGTPVGLDGNDVGETPGNVAGGAGTRKRKLVLDSFAVKRNAFRVAVETANMALRIGHTVEDIN